MKYRKKPVIVDAWQFQGEYLDAPDWLKERCAISNLIITEPGTFELRVDSKGQYLLIHTLEGSMVGSKGDWIIKGVKGEIYPCKSDIFDITYEEVK